MPEHQTQLVFMRDFAPRTGQCVAVAPGISRICAGNSGPYTFTGTNSYLLGSAQVGLVDPGPNDPNHLKALLNAIGNRKLTAIILTHTHKDHSALAPELARATGAPIWFAGPHRLSRPKSWWEANPLAGSCDWGLIPDRILHDGERLSFGETCAEIVTTPGHCANHICLGIVGQPYLLSGDHIMGWNSTLVATPDGSMGDYFHSLDRVIASPWTHFLPAHGGPIAAGEDYARALKTHRLERDTQIVQILSEGPASIAKIGKKLYPDLKKRLLFAAHLTIRAHLERLADAGYIDFFIGLSGRKARLKP